MITKNELRLHKKITRSSIPLERQRLAAQELLNWGLSFKDLILSFMSFHHEIETFLLNAELARRNNLVLPCMEKEMLTLYKVSSFEQLESTSFGLLQPNPNHCEAISPHLISKALIPGLAFDKNCHRLGYGAGYYDRFLRQYSLFSIGIGYKEQLVENLPYEPHDIPLDQIVLF